jgi:hypothetical protein
MHADKVDTDKTIKTKATTTSNAGITHFTKNDTKKMRHTRLTPTTKAMMDKTLTFQTRGSNDNSSENDFYFAEVQTRLMMRRKPMNLPKIQMAKALLVMLQKSMKIQS